MGGLCAPCMPDVGLTPGGGAPEVAGAAAAAAAAGATADDVVGGKGTPIIGGGLPMDRGLGAMGVGPVYKCR